MAQSNGSDDLGRCERAVLSVLAQFPEGRSHKQVALLSGYSGKSGGFKNALGKLRNAEPEPYIARGEPIRILPRGVEAIEGQYESLPEGDALFAYWLGRLGRAERAILEAVRHDGLTVEDVSERTGYSATSGGFKNALGKLRTLDLIEKGQPIALTPEFAASIS